MVIDLPAQSAWVPSTCRVKTSQLVPSIQAASPATPPAGSVAVSPCQVTVPLVVGAIDPLGGVAAKAKSEHVKKTNKLALRAEGLRIGDNGDGMFFRRVFLFKPMKPTKTRRVE